MSQVDSLDSSMFTKHRFDVLKFFLLNVLRSDTVTVEVIQASKIKVNVI